MDVALFSVLREAGKMAALAGLVSSQGRGKLYRVLVGGGGRGALAPRSGKGGKAWPSARGEEAPGGE